MGKRLFKTYYLLNKIKIIKIKITVKIYAYAAKETSEIAV